jgi:3'-5' exoribonuclease
MKTVSQFTVGENVKTYLMIKQIIRKNKKNGENYFRFELQDKSGSINGNIWSINEEMEALEKNTIVFVDALVEEFMGVKQLNIRSIEKSDGSLIENFVELAPVPVAKLKEEIEIAIGEINNSKIQRITRTLYEEYQSDFLVFPAAVRNHHEFMHGLAYHTHTMIRLAYGLKRVYPNINLDLLVGGIILHDAGKVIELSGPVGTEYTVKGKLIGHISIIFAEIARVARELGLENEEETMLLQHMILAHHGKNEYGSPVLPQILEAELLHMIDNIDARVIMIEKATNAADENSFSSRVFGLENRAFYNYRLRALGAEITDKNDKEESNKK